MKIRIASALVLAGMLTSGIAAAECVYPKAPGGIPDGNTATEEEMIAGIQRREGLQRGGDGVLELPGNAGTD